MQLHPLTIFIATIAMASAQILFPHHQPLPYAVQSGQLLKPSPLAHRAVVENAYSESQLPDELRNDFYKDSRIASGLAKESQLTDKEMAVYEREAEKIPREQVYKLFKNAGFIRRRRNL